MTTVMLHLMIKPPPPIARVIAQLRHRLGIASSYEKERFHLTVQPLGEQQGIGPELLDLILQVLAQFSAEPCEVAFDRLSNNALVGVTPKLPALRRMLLRDLVAAGVPVPDYDLRPHLSLAYGKGPLRNIPISRIGWLADEILLIRSVHGVGHDVLARVPLVARQYSFAFG